MKQLERIRYYTMNSWNKSTAPAYNLKVYNVIDAELQDKVFELMESEGFYDEINMLIHDFDIEHNYQWQAGFNGRSGGYLVLYRGGKHKDGRPFSYPSKPIDDDEVPDDVMTAFGSLAHDIVFTVENIARACDVVEQEYTVTKTRKVIVDKE